MLKTKRPTISSRSRYTNNYNIKDSYRDYDRNRSAYRYEKEDKYDTYVDIDLAYDDDYIANKRRYVRPEGDPRYSNFRNKYEKENSARYSAPAKKKAQKMSNKVKVLIGVYFLIVAVVVSLLIINALPVMNEVGNASANGLSEIERVEISPEGLGRVVMSDGSIVALNVTQSSFEYEYNINTNWFDNICDWMENIGA
ncbi:MAG: hypothetical protein HFK07_00475 [Clostridia bacterium]|jgi:hypothetical protein|nr:hypothetical protein [Clostridia bacterium]